MNLVNLILNVQLEVIYDDEPKAPFTDEHLIMGAGNLLTVEHKLYGQYLQVSDIEMNSFEEEG